MRSSWNLLVAVAAGLMLAPQLATASDVEEQLRQMQERMAQLEDKLQAQDDQLNAAEQRVEEQEKLIQDAGLNDESAGSALSRFLEQTEFSGVVAASWGYNFNNPKSPTLAAGNNPLGARGTGITNSGLNNGLFGLTNPFHSNPNTFQIDQLLFSMMKPATVESRGGFGIDLVYGASADALRNSGVGVNSGDTAFLYQAYAEYLAPIGNGMLVKAGRFETIVGTEVFRADENFNITRGLLYAMQPTSHTGLILSGEVGAGITLAGGIANDQLNTMADSDNAKTGLAQIAWSGETASLGFNVIVGGDVQNPLILLPPGAGVGKTKDLVTLFDVAATWDPSDKLGMWLNFDYWMPRKDGVAGTGDTDYWGIGLAGRYGVTDDLGVSLRSEYVYGKNAAVVCCLGGGGDGGHVQLIELTGTVDYALTDNLKVLGEVRWDKGMLEGTSNSVFIDGGVFNKSNQIQAMLQMLYTF